MASNKSRHEPQVLEILGPVLYATSYRTVSAKDVIRF